MMHRVSPDVSAAVARTAGAATARAARMPMAPVASRVLARVLAAGLLFAALGPASPAGFGAAANAEAAGPSAPAVGASGLPLPRYVSLKSDRVNLRQGPGTDYPTAWVYKRAGLPVEVIEEFETWRKVRDAEGTVGWVLQSLLSGRRTALVLPWELAAGKPAPQVPIRSSDSERSAPVVIVEAGVIADVQTCDGLWCFVTVGDYRGYIEQKKLWGIYEREQVR